MMKAILPVAVVLGALLGSAGQAEAQDVSAAASARRDISGYWRYNPQMSDNPSTSIPRDSGERRGGSEGGGGFGGGRRGGMGGGRGGGGRGGMGGGGFGGGGMGGRPGMSEAGRARMRQTMQLAMNPPSTLRIVRTDSTVTLVDVPIADTLRLRTNGKKIKEHVEGGGDLELKAEWKEDGLIIERNVNGGGKITETYFRSSDNKQMMVIVKLETNRFPKPVEFRRVYDSVTEGS